MKPSLETRAALKKHAPMGESGYARVKNDAYFTPAWVTEALLKLWKPRGAFVSEPACGRGDMAKVLVHELRNNGNVIIASDLFDYSYGHVGVNFFGEKYRELLARTCLGSIITNPPYSESDAFVARALVLMKEAGGEVAMLLRNEWDSGVTREALLTDHLRMKIVLNKRPTWITDHSDAAKPKRFGAKKKGGPRHNFAWFVWDFRYEGPATICWVR